MGINFMKLAKEGYEAYGKTTDFKNFQGNPMPAWDELPETIQLAWINAVEYVTDNAANSYEGELFGKIFYTDELGQVVCVRAVNDDGATAVYHYVMHKENFVSIGANFHSCEQGEVGSYAYLKSLTKEKAVELLKSALPSVFLDAEAEDIV